MMLKIVMSFSLLLLCGAGPLTQLGKQRGVSSTFTLDETKSSYEIRLKFATNRTIYVLDPVSANFGVAEVVDQNTQEDSNEIILSDFWPPRLPPLHRKWRDKKYIAVRNGDNLTYSIKKDNFCEKLLDARNQAYVKGMFTVSIMQHYLFENDLAEYRKENLKYDGYIVNNDIFSKHYESNKIKIDVECKLKGDAHLRG